MYSVANDGREMMLRVALVGNVGIPSLPERYIDTFYPWSITYDGVHKTPHVHWPVNPWRIVGAYHQTIAMIGYHRKLVPYAGHKVGRLSGNNWLAARARQFYFQHGEEGYPDWDPLHREPVFGG